MVGRSGSEPEKQYFFNGRDVTENKIAEEKTEVSVYDQLTTLPNPRVSTMICTN